MMKLLPLSRDRYLLAAVFNLLVILLVGCAITPDNWAFQKEVIKTDKLGQIHRIALLDVPQPSNIVLGDQFSDSATDWFGLVGMFTVESTEGNRITSGAVVSETARDGLRKWLEQADREVVLIQAERKNKSKMLKSYEQFSQVNADVILEIAPVSIGYKYEIGGAEFRKSKRDLSPDVFFKYRLVSTKTNEVLIESNVTFSSFYDYHKVNIKGVNLVGSRELIFDDEQFVKKHPEEAVSRLKYAIGEATKAIAEIVTNQGRTLASDPYAGIWQSERVTSGGFTYQYRVTVINQQLAMYNSAIASDRGRLVFPTKSDEDRWEGYWIGSRPFKRCIEEIEGSRNWGKVIWRFDDTGSSFEGTWDFCGEGRVYSWKGHRDK